MFSHLRKGKIPEDIPRELIHHYIRGYFDGDGSVYSEEKRIFASFVGRPESIIIDIRNKIAEYLEDDRGMKVYQKASSKKCWYFRIARQQLVAKLGNWLYQDATIYLDRKRERFKKYLRGG